MSFLLRGDQRGHYGGDRADPRDHPERRWRCLEEETDAHQHVNARRHHRRGVDQGGDRRRAFHRIRQPDVERELRRFADRAAEDQERGDGEVIRIARDSRELLIHLRENNRARGDPRHHDPEHETEIADAIGQERFLRRLRRRIALEPMADQQIGTDAHQFPEDEHHHEIVRDDDAEHREHEEGERREVARFARVVPHVA